MRNGRINPNLLPSDLVRGSPSADARAPSLSSDPRPRTGRGERSRERWRGTPHDQGATPARRCRPGAQRRAPSWRRGAGVVADSGRHAPRLHRPPEPEAPPTRAGVASRGSFGGALAQDGREGSGRQRVKIRDAPAARGGAGRDARRGETPVASPGAKILSATSARGGAGRDAPRRLGPPLTPPPPGSTPRPPLPPPSEPESPQPAHGSAPRVAASGCLSRELRRSPEPLTGERAPDAQRAKIRDGFW